MGGHELITLTTGLVTFHDFPCTFIVISTAVMLFIRCLRCAMNEERVICVVNNQRRFKSFGRFDVKYFLFILCPAKVSM